MTSGDMAGGFDALLGRAELYVRGLSTRDVEVAFLEAFREEVLSRSGVSRLGRELQVEFHGWRRRVLSGLRVVYLFLDACCLPVRQGVTEKEGVLCAHGIPGEGRRVLLHLGLGGRESHAAWLGFLHEMVARGLREPLLVISDGQPGLLKALGEVFPQMRRQRRLVHKMGSILTGAPGARQAEMKRLVQQVYQASTHEEGKRRAQALIARLRDRYLRATGCLAEDLEACLEQLRFPAVRRQRIGPSTSWSASLERESGGPS